MTTFFISAWIGRKLLHSPDGVKRWKNTRLETNLENLGQSRPYSMADYERPNFPEKNLSQRLGGESL